MGLEFEVEADPGTVSRELAGLMAARAYRDVRGDLLQVIALSVSDVDKASVPASF